MAEEILTQKSELEILLEKNLSLDLTEQEFNRARGLIKNPQYSKESCWVCKTEGIIPNQSIYDTSICQEHALYALVTRK